MFYKKVCDSYKCLLPADKTIEADYGSMRLCKKHISESFDFIDGYCFQKGRFDIPPYPAKDIENNHEVYKCESARCDKDSEVALIVYLDDEKESYQLRYACLEHESILEAVTRDEWNEEKDVNKARLTNGVAIYE